MRRPQHSGRYDTRRARLWRALEGVPEVWALLAFGLYLLAIVLGLTGCADATEESPPPDFSDAGELDAGDMPASDAADAPEPDAASAPMPRRPWTVFREPSVTCPGMLAHPDTDRCTLRCGEPLCDAGWIGGDCHDGSALCVQLGGRCETAQADGLPYCVDGAQ